MTDLLSLDTVRARLKLTEPLAWRTFSVGENIRFEAPSHAQLRMPDADTPIGMYAVLHDQGRYQLTRSALEELGATAGLRRPYMNECPPQLLVPHLNYWYRGGLLSQPRKKTEYQFFTVGDTAMTFTKQQTRTPVSNLKLLDTAVERMTGTVHVDPAFNHDLRRTTIRLIMPGQTFSVAGDRWSYGIQIRNSLTGVAQTWIDGFFYCWDTESGQVDTSVSQGPLSRGKGYTDDDVTTWIQTAVTDVLIGLTAAVNDFKRAAETRVDTNLTQTLKDLFDHHRISVQHRTRIIDNILSTDMDSYTIYDLMQAVAMTATEPGLAPNEVDSLMKTAGDIPHHTDLCAGCHRFTHRH